MRFEFCLKTAVVIYTESTANGNATRSVGTIAPLNTHSPCPTAHTAPPRPKAAICKGLANIVVRSSSSPAV